MRRELKGRLQAAAMGAGRALAMAVLAAMLFAGSASATPALSVSAPQPIDGGTPLSSVSCPSESLCMAVDRAGHALSSSSPGTGAWSGPAAIDGLQPLSGVSCPSTGLCVAVDEVGQALTTLNPGPFAGWSVAVIDPANRLRSVSCTGASLCVAVDDAGRALTTLNPGPGAVWSTASIDPALHLRSVSCTGSSSCVAVDEAGNLFASENPASGSWRVRALGGLLTTVSCFPGGCVAAATNGNVLASADPWSPAPTWSTTPVTGAHPAAASCTTVGLCVAVDDGSATFASIHAAGGVPEWSAALVPGGSSMTGVSCAPGGLCVAVDTSGRAIAARVPLAEATTVAPLEVTAATATIAGVVDPHGAALADCHFEYGTTNAYGGVVPCAAAPSATGGAQQVTAQLQGLEANTTYHYRVLATSAAGTKVGADQSFTTAVSNARLIVPHPSVSGTPASGQRLSCHTGIAEPGGARITYAWLRDLLPIPNATGSTYVVRGGDAGFHIQCQVTATNAGGSASAKSAFVTVPVQGVPAAVGETSVGRAQVRGTTVNVPVRCSSDAGGGCQVLLRVSVVETISGGRVVAVGAGGARARAAARRRTVTIAGVRVHLGRAQRRTLTLSLNRAGRALMAHRRSLPATLTVSGTVIGVIEASLAQERIVLGAAPRSASRHRSSRAH